MSDPLSGMIRNLGPYEDEEAEYDIGLRGLELLDHIIKVVEAYPERFHMADWVRRTQSSTGCRTAMCIGGWAAHLTGARMIYCDSLMTTTSTCGDDEGGLWSIFAYARSVLHLPEWAADNLFSASNTLADVKRLRNEYAEKGVFTDAP